MINCTAFKFKQAILMACMLCCTPVSFAAQSGWYVSGGLGWAKQYDLPSDLVLSPWGATQQTANYFANRVSAGYSHLVLPNLYLGAELGWGNYGKTDYGIGSLKSSAWDALIVGTWELSPRYDVFAKVGVAREELQVPSNLTAVLGNNPVEYNPMTGLGLAYSINSSTQLHIDYNHIFGNTVSVFNTSATPSIDTILIGLRHTF